jgi:hypothetical protein
MGELRMVRVEYYNFRYYLGNCLERLRKSTKTLSLVHRSLKVRVLNLRLLLSLTTRYCAFMLSTRRNDRRGILLVAI